MDKKTEESPPLKPATSEKFMGLIGLLLVSGLLLYLARQGLYGDDGYPEIHLQGKEVVAQEQGYLLTFAAQNRGGRTAAAVEIEGELLLQGAAVEQARASVDFLAPHSTRMGGLFFSRDPRDFDLTLRATGYIQP
jgi:uncharacterized protein (TIGR02588 family)